jgi:uncharacterized damage-inducible protein DinB
MVWHVANGCQIEIRDTYIAGISHPLPLFVKPAARSRTWDHEGSLSRLAIHTLHTSSCPINSLRPLLPYVVFQEMLTMTTGLADMFRFNRWANLRLLDACANLSDTQLDATMNGTFGSLRQTLMHLLSSEEGYARTLTGDAPTLRLDESAAFPGFDELRRRAEMSAEKLIAYLEQERDLSQILWLDKGTYKTPVIVVVIQAIDHGIDHRSQICTLLTQQDITPPELDAWAYNDEVYAKSGE